MQKILKNYTPHAINIVRADGSIVMTIPSEGVSIRLKTETAQVGEVNGIPLTKTIFGEPEGLPEEREDTILVVSQLVKNALPDRKDLVVPAEQVRDAEGRVIGCLSLGI